MTKLEELREKANRLPLLPGVYIMLDASSQVIYVGKAKRLKNRVTSYFRGEHLPKVAAMVAKVDDFNVIIAETEFEALVLENSLIKRHKPHYNILLKDDKGYPFLRLDPREPYARLTLVNRFAQDGARYFGPYGGRGQTNAVVDTLSKALGLPTCGRKFPRDIGKDRPCLQFQLGQCRGWCRGEPGEAEYRAAMERAILVLEGKSAQLRAQLQQEMEKAAEELRFEEAARLRDRIRAIETLGNRQRVIAAARSDTDAIGFQRGAKSCFSVLHYTDGDLSGKDFNLLEDPTEEDGEALSALLRQYYSNRTAYPRTVLLPFPLDDQAELEEYFSQMADHRVYLEVPQRGDRVRFVEKAAVNAREEILRSTTAEQRRSKTLSWLQEALQLADFPHRIEAYDISNTGNVGIVSSMTVHVDGKPLKRDYRKFHMKDIESQDDYGSMRETITRRFRRYLEGDEKFGEKPDVLFIDGGPVHAAAAESALSELGLSLPVFGMVKDDRHRTRALVTSEGREIGIQANPAAFALVGRIQEETHRFAIEYHRSLRDSVPGSTLNKIPGVGEKRRNELLRHFGTVKAIRAASEEELAAAVPRNTARAVYSYFHPENGGSPEETTEEEREETP
ncbi:MAG: excinuclease ABC subunit UvrC [Oscillospiraceae bacterium]|nr:excinuclease ABC subunit UvrC [Oscillospiraceae bacterium]